MYRTRLVALCFVIISIVSAILAGICIGTEGRNCTEEFTLYKELRDITEKEELISYLTERNISYTIKDDVLALKDFELISFALSGNSCSVKKNNSIKALEMVDSKDSKEVKYEETFDSEKTITKYSYNDTDHCIKVDIIDGNYFIREYSLLILWLVVSIVVFVISAICCL